jgi:arylsulfatase A-like enzyme
VHAVQSLAAELVPALRFNGRPHWIQDFQRPGEEVLARTLNFIRRDDPRPWFAFVNLYDVHWPYVPEGEGREALVRPYAGPVDGFLFRSDAWQPGYALDEHDKRHVNDLYEGEIHDLDALVTRFLDALDLERGGTAVLITADHGEGMGEGDTWNHDDVREVQVRVPMILRLPQPTPRAERRSCAVSGVDVAPTLLELAGLPVPAGMQGQSLLAPSAPGRERWIDDRDHVAGADFRCALYRDGFKLVRFGRTPAVRYELYDLARDAGGFHDVQAEHPELFQELMARMEARGGGTTLGGDVSRTADALEALGYAGDE